MDENGVAPSLQRGLESNDLGLDTGFRRYDGTEVRVGYRL